MKKTSKKMRPTQKAIDVAYLLRHAHSEEQRLYVVENLSGVNLRGANLSGANLEGAYLVGADLGWSNLQYANLHKVNLADANLRGTKF